LIGLLLDRIRTWLQTDGAPDKCLQCGLPQGRQFLIATNEPIMHPHQCSWCKSILYVPGPMYSCKGCSADPIQPAAA
jgi:hypothetical protein